MSNGQTEKKTVLVEKGCICENCHYWNIETHLCHRYAPRPADVLKNTAWPATIASDFCGEFKDKRPAKVGGGFIK